MPKTSRVSFLLLNWNGIEFTRKCILTLLKISYPNFDIIVVDNGSQNKEADQLKKEFCLSPKKNKDKVKVVKSSKNLGYAAGMNLAIKNSTGEYIMILNNDMEFGKDWFSILLNTLEKDPSIAMCQPKIKDMQNKSMFEHGGAAGGFMDMLGYPFARGRIFSAIERDQGQYDKVIPICWCGVMLARKKVIDEVGGFNPIYFNYDEDRDLCFKIYGRGYKILNVPLSVVYHFGGAALGKNMSKKFFFHHRNGIIFMLINFPVNYLFLILIPRLFLDFVTIFYYAFSGYPSFSLSVIRAYISLITLLSTIVTERKKTQKLLKINVFKVMPVYRGSIVWKYFVERKKIFSNIIKAQPLYNQDNS